MSGELASEQGSTEPAEAVPLQPTADRPPAGAVAAVHRPAPPDPAFVYAIGQIDWRFPSIAVEKEYAQATATAENAGRTDREVSSSLLARPEYRYLARQLCWVFLVEGLETYVVVPRDPQDLQLLVDSIRDESSRDDVDVLIGVRGHVAPPEMCNGLALPVVAFDQIYSFHRDALIDSIPMPDSVKGKDAEDRFRSAASDLFGDLRRLADNTGATDEHRALNYLAVRYPRMYAVTTERHDRNYSLAGVEVRPSPLSGARTVVDVVFAYRHRETDVVEKEFVRVDVTEEFPFLVTKMSPFYER